MCDETGVMESWSLLTYFCVIMDLTLWKITLLYVKKVLKTVFFFKIVAKIVIKKMPII